MLALRTTTLIQPECVVESWTLSESNFKEHNDISRVTAGGSIEGLDRKGSQFHGVLVGIYLYNIVLVFGYMRNVTCFNYVYVYVDLSAFLK